MSVGVFVWRVFYHLLGLRLANKIDKEIYRGGSMIKTAARRHVRGDRKL